VKQCRLLFLTLFLFSLGSFVAAPIADAQQQGGDWDAKNEEYVRIFQSWSGDRTIDITITHTNGQGVTVQVYRGTTPSNDSSNKPVRPTGAPHHSQALDGNPPYSGVDTASEIWICRSGGVAGTSKGTFTWSSSGTFADGNWTVDVDTFDTVWSGDARSMGYSVSVDEGQPDVLLQVLRNNTFVEQTVVAAGRTVSGIADDVTTIQVSTLGNASSGTFQYTYKTGPYHVGQ